MKVSQIAVGGAYENKKSTEVRKVTFCGSAVVHYVVLTPTPLPVFAPQRRHSVTLREFAKWAARPAGKKEDVDVRAVRLARARMK